MKKVISLLMVVCLVAALFAGCTTAPAETPATPGTPGTPATPAETAFALKIGHVLNTESPFHAGAVEFARLIEEKSEGSLTAEVFPSALLGNDRELAEGLQLGTVDMAVVGSATVSGFAPKIQLFDLPFLFRDADHAYKVLDGDIGKQLLDDFYQNSGIRALAFWENGFRNITNSKLPIKSAADVDGIKLRVQEIACHIDFWKEVGANPTPMAWTEVYTALQQGTVDGQENPVQTIYTQKIYEVQPYLSLTRHVYAPAMILLSDTQYAAMSENQQKIMSDSAFEAATYERQFIADLENGALDKLPELGVEITTPEEIDLDSFRAAAQPVLETYGTKLGAMDLIKQIQETK
jgi:tripartite ATP-independent transporter DctP family solute receptor